MPQRAPSRLQLHPKGNLDTYVFHFFYFTLDWSQVHWDNGFLAYWDTKQLPNFLLAVPCVLMVLHHSWEFVQVGKVMLRLLQRIANM